MNLPYVWHQMGESKRCSRCGAEMDFDIPTGEAVLVGPAASMPRLVATSVVLKADRDRSDEVQCG